MKTVLLVQSVYFFLTGIWPLIHLRSFIFVTGPKTDTWLVKTAGVLITAIALSLFTGIYSTEIPAAVAVLALSSSAGLAAIDWHFGLAGIIRSVYIADGVLELFFSGTWILYLAGV